MMMMGFARQMKTGSCTKVVLSHIYSIFTQFNFRVSIDISFYSGTWWQRRTRLERRLSLCATVVVFVAVGLAVAVAALIYRGQQTDQSKGTTFLKTFLSGILVEVCVCESPRDLEIRQTHVVTRPQ